MLVLSRRPGEQLVIDGQITVTVLEVRGRQIKLGLTAPPEVNITRSELLEAARFEGMWTSGSPELG